MTRPSGPSMPLPCTVSGAPTVKVDTRRCASGGGRRTNRAVLQQRPSRSPRGPCSCALIRPVALSCCGISRGPGGPPAPVILHRDAGRVVLDRHRLHHRDRACLQSVDVPSPASRKDELRPEMRRQMGSRPVRPGSGRRRHRVASGCIARPCPGLPATAGIVGRRTARRVLRHRGATPLASNVTASSICLVLMVICVLRAPGPPDQAQAMCQT